MDNKMPGRPPKPKLDWKMLGRVMGYIFKNYKLRLAIVIICIILNSLASVGGNLYLQVLIDDHIVPLIGVENPVLTGLIKAIGTMIVIYLVGIIASLVHSLLMVTISEGTLKLIRDEMFVKMQRLPIRYFDTNTHGDIMSRYTNDTDTLSNMIAQSIPNFFSSAITIVTVFVSMCATNIYLTIVVMLSLSVILFATRFITSRSGKYFMRQQQAVGKLNGYVEEMIHGQKVVKVFCYEDRAKDEFEKINSELCETVYNANKYANNIGPVNGALGNIQYALLALIGGLLAVNGIGNVSVG